jgi:REP element-mobilizing transposase RayT
MRKTAIYRGETHHIYNRGVNYGDIFFTRANWLFFLHRLRAYCPPEKGTIIAYCLMPNHFHLLVTAHIEDFGKKVMQRLGVSYTKAINKQKKRVGSLFQGPFQNRRVESEGKLLHLSRYIHLNPVTAGFVEKPEDWEFSSYREYVGLRRGTLPCPDIILDYFDSPEAYAEFVMESEPAQKGIDEALLID